GYAGNQLRDRMAEHDPEADPACRKAEVHWIPNVAGEADDDEPLGWKHRRWSPVADPAKIPDAAKRHPESESGGNCGEPAPRVDAGEIHVESQPARQQPEPERKECRAHEQGSNRRENGAVVRCAAGVEFLRLHCVPPRRANVALWRI